MGYSRTTWATSDVITAAKLNNIEQHLTDVADAIVQARRTGSNQNLTASTDTRLVWNTEDSDPDGLYDNTTGRFTAAIAGVYLFVASAQMWAGAFTGTNQQALKVYKNGALLAVLSDRERFRGPGPVSGVVALSLAASDYVEFYMNSANSTPYMDDDAPSFLHVARIS